MLCIEEINKLTCKDGQPNLSEMEGIDDYVDVEELGTLQKLKEERIKELIKRQIEELENPKVIQRPNSLAVLPEPKLIDQDLQYFGYELFYNAPTTFTPVENMPVPQNHILGPGDNIKVILFGIINDEYTLKITREGYAFFPEIGPIFLGGFSFTEAKEIVSEAASSFKQGLQAYISMGALRTIQVFVVGDAYQPGTYNVSSMSTLTNALFASGGIRTEGSLRDIQVRRNGKTVTNFDFYDFLLKGDNSNDITLDSGDVIFIPPVKNSIGISGQVRRPAIFELQEGETIEDLLVFAGGFLATADTKNAEIEKIIKTNDRSGFTRQGIDLSTIKNADTTLEDGDMLNIYPIVNKMQDVILLTGYTQKPGFYPWRENLKIKDFIGSAADLLPETDRNYVVIKREDPTTGLFSAHQLDLDQIFSNDGSSDADLILNPRDEILFFSKKSQQERKNMPDQKDSENKTQSSKMKINPDKEIIVIKNNTLEIIEKDKLPSYLTEGYRTAEFLIQPGRESVSDIVNNDLETLVVKGNEVQLIEKSLLASYEGEGYEEAKFDSQETRDFEKVNLINAGDRDVILEPFIDTLRRQASSDIPEQVVKINGNVYFPGSYPLSINMNLKQIINASGGLQDKAFVEDIEITRKTIRNNKYEITRFSVSGLNKELLLSTKLQSGDEILIKAIEDVTKYAEIKGEVFFPGKYPLQDGDTMRDLIERAGGLKDTAFKQGAVFLREAIKKAEQLRLTNATARLQRELILGTTQAGLGTESKTASSLAPLLEILNTTNEEDMALGRLVIDLDGIIAGQYTDIILEDGDSLAIPKEMQSVAVIGEVYVPTAHLHSSKLDVNDYINLSGGITKFADIDSSYIIKANGSIQIGSSVNSSSFFRGSNINRVLEPGDTVVVPVETSQFNTFKAANDITQIIYQMAITAAAVNSFK